MDVIRARRQTYQHKLIKLTTLVVVCTLFLSFTLLRGDVDSNEASIQSERSETVHDKFVYMSGATMVGSRGLEGIEEGCKKPGSKGSKEAICAYISTNCPKSSGGYIDYLDLFYCSKWLGGNRSLAWVTFVFWVLFLFLALGTISNDYLVPALTSISYTLSIPAEIAGLTLLAAGNGAPNVAGYFAAVTNRTFDLAVGDVFGGTFYVITIVLSCVCLFGKNILLDGHSFRRDIVFLTIAVISVFIFIWTGRFYIYESIALLAFYLIYVIWASVYDLMRQRRERLALKRARAAAGLPMPSKRSYRSRSSVFKKQVIEQGEDQPLQTLDPEVTLPPTQISNDLGDKDSVHTKNGHSSPQKGKKHFDIIDSSSSSSDDARDKQLQRGASVGFSEKVEVVHISQPTNSEQTNGKGAKDGKDEAENGGPPSSPRGLALLKSKFSSRALRAAFARVTESDSLIGKTVTSELNADVEDILAPPVEGKSVKDNATYDDETLVIPNVHLYQEAMEEELDETQKKGNYVWDIYHWKQQFVKLALIGKIYYIFTYPLNVPLFLTIPTTRWNRATSLASLVTAWPIIFGALNLIESKIKSIDFPIVVICIGVGAIAATVLFFLTDTMKPPKFKIFFLFWAFIVSVFWIYLIASELINSLQAVGKILSIADILLGATVLTWGNSISDLVADSALAAGGDARIAMGALYGGPMFSTQNFSPIFFGQNYFPFFSVPARRPPQDLRRGISLFSLD